MKNVIIFHGTEGYPEENWFPWMKEKLEAEDCQVFVPQFPSPPIVPSKISEWFDVLKNYEQYINKDTILIGHSLGGLFLLRVLEKLDYPIHAAVFVSTPVGEKPILNWDRDSSFCGFNLKWDEIKNKAKNFIVYQSDDDPYVGLANGEKLAKELGVELTFIPNAGHFNKPAGYTEFPHLLEKLKPLL